MVVTHGTEAPPRARATAQVAPLLFTVPVTSGLAAWILLDEEIVMGQVIGTAAVVGGLVLNQRAGPPPSPQPETTAPAQSSSRAGDKVRP